MTVTPRLCRLVQDRFEIEVGTWITKFAAQFTIIREYFPKPSAIIVNFIA